MKLVSYVLLFCMTFNVFASTGTVQELERQLDDYQYAMSVEWDQKNQDFYNKETNAFFDKLSALIKTEGLSNEQIMNLLEKKVSNKQVLESIKLKVSLLTKVNSPAELAAVLRDNAQSFYVKGASWNGDVALTVGIGVVLAAVLGYAIWFSATHKCVQYSTRYECRAVNYGSSGYNDYNSGFYSTSSYTSCGYYDYCVQYEKK
jgi:hypothetical protein